MLIIGHDRSIVKTAYWVLDKLPLLLDIRITRCERTSHPSFPLNSLQFFCNSNLKSTWHVLLALCMSCVRACILYVANAAMQITRTKAQQQQRQQKENIAHIIASPVWRMMTYKLRLENMKYIKCACTSFTPVLCFVLFHCKLHCINLKNEKKMVQRASRRKVLTRRRLS